MRTLAYAFVLIATTTACEHKKGDGQPQPVKTGKAPMDAVRAPVASDLAEYTKDIKGDGQLTANIETPLGTIHCRLLDAKAPMTVANFVGLATGKKPYTDPKTGAKVIGTPYYDGQIFHRVIPGFMIQGGDIEGTGMGGPGYAFEDEIDDSEKMEPGTLAMANTGRPVSNGSQFFVTSGSPRHLNGKHTIFGRCKEVELVSQIENVPASSDRPNTPVTMKVTITRQAW